MRKPDEFLAQVTKRLSRTLLSETLKPGQDWPHSFPLAISTSAGMAQTWPETRAWAMEWARWAASRDVELLARDVRVNGIKQHLPTHAIVGSIEQAAALLGGDWPDAIVRHRGRAATIASTFPAVDLPRALRMTMQLSDVDFALAVEAALYFRDNVTAGMTARQIPVVGMHSKWLNAGKAVVSFLAGRSSLDLVDRPQLVAFTYLDERHLETGRRYDSTVVGDVSAPAYLPSTVVICENSDNALFFPRFRGAVAVQGGGFTGAAAIASIEWVANANHVLYWGDMDAAGYSILNRYRSHLPHLRSILMGREAFDEFQIFGLRSGPRGEALPTDTPYLDALTSDERDVYGLVTDPAWGGVRRIEQERLPFPTVIDGTVIN